MNEFARVLSEIIDRGKTEKRFNIQKLAQHAEITPSYLSNMKQANRKPPSHKTLIKVADSLRNFGIPEADIERLVKAYNRTQLGLQPESNLLSSLIDSYHKEKGFLEQLQQDVRTKKSARKKQLKTKKRFEQKTLELGLIEGDQEIVLLQASLLFKKAVELQRPGGKMYVTWYHCSPERELNETSQYFLDTLRSFLWGGSPLELVFLCSDDVAENFMMLQQFLANFIGTSNCSLYRVPNGPHLPQYFAVENVGFVEARPKSADRYWIRTVVIDDVKTGQPNEMSALQEYFEYSLGSSDRQLIIQTAASLERYTLNPGLKQLAAAEHQYFARERLLIKSSFSTIFWPVETLRAKLQALQLPQDKVTSYMRHHLARTKTLLRRLEYGQERAIHPKNFFHQKFMPCLEKAFSANSDESAVNNAEIELLKGQILLVLHAIVQNSSFYFALTDQELPITFTLIGDIALLGFDLPHMQDKIPIKDQQLEAVAWTHHPGLVYQLQAEFNMKWDEIAHQWRSDTDEGKRHIVNFIAAESLKAFLRANAPPHELWAFMKTLAETASSLDVESFIGELYLQEQVAKELVIVCHNLPFITMPVSIGPWDPRSAIRTRQYLLSSILRAIRSCHIITTQYGIEQYWKANQYGTHTFTREWTEHHFQYVHDFLGETSDTTSIEVVPLPAQFPVNFEIIDREFISIGNVEEATTRGILIHDPELARELMAYIERNLTAHCPESLKGAKNVTKWLEAQFMEKKSV
jgi:transcriptional regulator with XRE-family HTH domain